MTAQVALLDLDHVAQRLRVQVPELHIVAHVEDLATAQSSTVISPSAWVVPTADEASGSDLDRWRVQQTIASSWAVVFALASYPPGDTTGHQLLREIRGRVLAALLGWTPPGADGGAYFLRGGLSGFDDSIVWWEDSYGCPLSIRQDMT